MNKEAVNTFQEGLNYDLNPITTPNNVLTDCVNGTFITFNGDELALQNDAGNTKILVPGTENEYVQLSADAFPLAVKEHGGVLYVVSGIIPEYVNYLPWVTYPADRIIWYEIPDPLDSNKNIKHYYRSLVNNNLGKTPTTNPDYWEHIGDWSAVLLKEGKIEFGSYPSPEFASNRQFTNQLNISLGNESLYSPKVMNNDVFKSGRYITFASNTINSGWISNLDSNGDYAPRLYKVKLWHQLNNGLIDLTEDVLNKYKLFRQRNPVGKSPFWFAQSDFVYFCPNQYKGKLALSMEIEPMAAFQLYEFPTLKFENNQYILTIKVKGDYGNNKVLSFGGMSIKLIVDDVVRQEIGMLDAGLITYDEDTNVYTATLSMPNDDTYKNKIVRYEIIPSLTTVDPFDERPTLYEKDDYIESFPIEFRRNYVITGERFVTSQTSTIVFDLVEVGGECNTQTGIYTYKVAVLKNASGQYLDSTLTPTTVPHAFVLDGYTNATYTTVGKYTITAQGKPNVLVSPVPTVSEDVIQVFQDEVVSFESAACKQVTATIVTSNAVNLSDVLVTQGTESITVTKVNDTTYTCSVVPSLNFNISVSKEGFSNTYHSTAISSNKIIKLALIPELSADMWSSELQNIYDVDVYWHYYDPNLSDISCILMDGGSFNMVSNASVEYRGSTYTRRVFSTVNISVNSGTYFDGGDYDNISGSPGMYKSYAGYIFKATYNLPWNYLGTINPI